MKLNSNFNIISLLIPNNKEEAEIVKLEYVKRMKENGIKLEFQKDMFIKKSFWKFWKREYYNIAIFKILI